jgi:hypothetical protein
MLITGCDFHTRYQQIAMMDDSTGELTERRLDHHNGEGNTFYRRLTKPVRVGIEATGPMHWFKRELGHELWVGDSAKIRASDLRKQNLTIIVLENRSDLDPAKLALKVADLYFDR